MKLHAYNIIVLYAYVQQYVSKLVIKVIVNSILPIKRSSCYSVDRRRSMSRESSPKIEDPKFADIFTLYQSIEGAELKKKRSYSCLTIALSLKDQMLIVSTQAHSLKGVYVCVCMGCRLYKIYNIYPRRCNILSMEI